MKDGNDCNETFPQGITNGAYWYDLSGGMQDFNYVFTNCFEITLELSCCKYPSKSELANEWHKNKKSLIEYMKLTHIGIKGLVKDINGYPINDAEIFIQGVEDKPVKTTERGEFWRLLTPGTYNVRAIAFGWVIFCEQVLEGLRVGDDGKMSENDNFWRDKNCYLLFIVGYEWEKSYVQLGLTKKSIESLNWALICIKIFR